VSRKMDDSRRASKDRDSIRSGARAARDAPWRGGNFDFSNPYCPDCKDSLARMTWNPRTELWEHRRCGATMTIQEVEESEQTR